MTTSHELSLTVDIIPMSERGWRGAAESAAADLTARVDRDSRWRLVGVGTDVTDHTGLSAGLDQWGARWLARWCSATEVAQELRHPPIGPGCPDMARIAPRWAIKECVTKVLSPTADFAWPWTSIEIIDLQVPGESTIRLRDVAGVLARGAQLSRLDAQVQTAHSITVVWCLAWGAKVCAGASAQ